MQACLAAYNNFTQHHPLEVYGITVERIEAVELIYKPENVGCNAPEMVERRINQELATSNLPPVELLDSLQLPIGQMLVEDFNLDGIQEWLIWLESPMPPFFFYQMGEAYHISRPSINPFQQADDIVMASLPDDLGVGVIYVTDEVFVDKAPWFCIYEYICGMGGGGFYQCADNQQFTTLRIWFLDGEQWGDLFWESICASDLTTIFTSDNASD